MSLRTPITLCILIFCALSATAFSQDNKIPDALKPWSEWATWDAQHTDAPAIYSSYDQRIGYWPSELTLDVDQDGGRFATEIRAFESAWIPLPGSDQAWPIEVTDNDEPIAVVKRDGAPGVWIEAGTSKIAGKMRWNRMPQSIAIPNSFGILSVTAEGKPIAVPDWDANGRLWLRRNQDAELAKEQVSVNVFRVIDDGIPVWLRTEVELTVSGKSREVELGHVLPQDWRLSSVHGPLPVAIENGQMKAQVRAGKWTIALDAFQAKPISEISFADKAAPIIDTELIGLRTDPTFRVAQVEGLPSIDASQTSFPAKWRDMPVYQWQTNQPFQVIEKMRGMGQTSPQGLNLTRRLWLDEDGSGFTYQDQFKGGMQKIWRLDINDESTLGAARMDGEAQLITANPNTNAAGIEIRRRDINLEAIGRIDRAESMPATGWRADTDSLDVTLTLPPGWRTLAVFGADEVDGDWLTAWSLLDLFLLLIFSIAVCRLHGLLGGLIALLAFGLAYHELGAPRFTWLFVLIPIALLRVVDQSAMQKWITAWKYIAVALLLLCLIPFVARQTQQALYPQLEPAGYSYGSRGVVSWPTDNFQRPRIIASIESRIDSTIEGDMSIGSGSGMGRAKFQTTNLSQDPQSKVPTGPAKPQWDWNGTHCRWNGPVSMDQQIQPIFISATQSRILTVARIVLLMLLAVVVLRDKKLRLPWFNRKAAASVLALMVLMFSGTTVRAQIPDDAMLQTLRQRLLETPDAFPNAAEISSVDLTMTEDSLEMDVEIHAAARVAVPLPGKLPTWSPVKIESDRQNTDDSDENLFVCRRDGFLWVLVPKGISRVKVTGRLPSEADWEWTFQLKPHYVSVDADGWKVTGINSNGVPGNQVFFVRQQPKTTQQAAYDRTEFEPIVKIDRHFEIGLVSKLRTVVTRLSSPGKAISIDVPLLADESVLNERIDTDDGAVAVRMSAKQKTFTWESEFPYGSDLRLVADESGNWVEQWHLASSPIWNVAIDGLTPIFEDVSAESSRSANLLIPTWKPWPGETATIRFESPKTIDGDLITIQSVNHQVTLGQRRRVNELKLQVECSVATDLPIDIGAESDVTSLKVDQQTIPVQRDGAKLIVPANPGKQLIVVQWKSAEELQTFASSSEIDLSVDASNVTRSMIMPENRWVLWADGPQRGPAVRFWLILIVAFLAAIALGSVPHSPLGRIEWILLVIGLTQVPLIAAMTVVGWLFLLSWRGRAENWTTSRWRFNALQVLLVVLTGVSMVILMLGVREGLLGHPRMFILGNGSSGTFLQWFQARSTAVLPETSVVSVSVWYYRFLMLCWALWLATAVLRWLTWGWKQFSTNGTWRAPNNRAEPITATVVEENSPS